MSPDNIPDLNEPHQSKWKVYSNPPGGFASTISFATQNEANVYLAANEARGITGLQIIPPKAITE